MAGSALRLLLALLSTALLVKSDQPGSLVSDDLAEEGYLLASDLFHLPAEGSGGGVEGSAEGSVDIELEEEEEEDFPRLRNITIFPACIADDDCHKYFSADKVQDYKCFQYMCYPWQSSDGPFRRCKRNSDCTLLSESEGGDGSDGGCFKHPDRRSVR